jgi:hypothetical protein
MLTGELFCIGTIGELNGLSAHHHHYEGRLRLKGWRSQPWGDNYPYKHVRSPARVPHQDEEWVLGMAGEGLRAMDLAALGTLSFKVQILSYIRYRIKTTRLSGLRHQSASTARPWYVKRLRWYP